MLTFGCPNLDLSARVVLDSAEPELTNALSRSRRSAWRPTVPFCYLHAEHLG